jgi:molecular chaperone HtpG
MPARTESFKTEVRQLLDLVIHSLYSKKEIFLRELISNASDAIDRAQLEALTDKSLLEADPEWKIRIVADRAARTLTVSDNGIGMSLEEVERNIGTIANSGTRQFLDALRQAGKGADVELIGQFGVGFYSSFMVADQVTVLTRRAGANATAVRWVSTGDGQYTVEEGEKPGRGTDVTLHLREGLDEFLEEWRIQAIVKHYSDYIATPIAMEVTRKKKGKLGAEEEAREEEVLNSQRAIWRKSRNEISEEAYNLFYKHLTHDHADPLKAIHYVGEGATEFRALVYLPSHAPFDLLMREDRRGLHLYVKNVFIMDDCKDLLPPYLRFVKGVVDSSDLPLNVSREILQDNATIRRIRKNLVGRILGALAEMKTEKAEHYRTFYREFGKVLKEGLHYDPENADKVKDLLLFRSTKTTDGEPVSLRQYAERMPATQKAIYYITAENETTAAASPHLEAFRARDLEVLYFADPVDEWLLPRLEEYDGKKLRPVHRGDVDLDTGDEKKQREERRDQAERDLRGLLDFLRAHLQDDIASVRLSDRLTESACCLVAPDDGLEPHMEKMLRAMNQDVPKIKRILEVNPGHPAVRAMAGMLEKDKKDPALKDYAELLYDQALIGVGAPPRDAARFTRLVSSLMAGKPAG